MLIMKRSGKDYRALMGWGQLLLLVGMLTSSFSDGSFVWLTIGKEFIGDALSSSLRGFLAGLSVPMLGASIFLNLRGLILYRQARG